MCVRLFSFSMRVRSASSGICLQVLTLASGDRFSMSDNTKLMFENEHLNNASPATVSRAGIVFVSESDLGWQAVTQAWLANLVPETRDLMMSLLQLYLGYSEAASASVPTVFDFLRGNGLEPLKRSEVSIVTGFLRMLDSLLRDVSVWPYALVSSTMPSPRITTVDASAESKALRAERLVCYTMCWGIGGILEGPDRLKWDSYLRSIASQECLPKKSGANDTVFEYIPDCNHSSGWRKLEMIPLLHSLSLAPLVNYQDLLIPTSDAVAVMTLLARLQRSGQAVLITGAYGAGKSSTAKLYLESVDARTHSWKRINFSHATTPLTLQASMNALLEKRGGKSYGPMNGKHMTVFVDDVSMPEVNKWGDQPTNELLRQLLDQRGYYFLDKDKRGDFKVGSQFSV